MERPNNDASVSGTQRAGSSVGRAADLVALWRTVVCQWSRTFPPRGHLDSCAPQTHERHRFIDPTDLYTSQTHERHRFIDLIDL